MRVFKRGSKWCVDYVYKGRRHRKAVSRDKRTAEKVLHDIELKIDRGEYLGIVEQEKVLLRDFAQRYLNFSRANKRLRSYKRDVTSLNALLPVLGDFYLAELKHDRVEQYKQIRRGQVSPASANRELGCLRHLLNKAIEWGCLQHSPMSGFKLLKEPPGRVRFLTEEELRMLLAEASPKLRPVILMAAMTGMRLGEVMGLTWGQVNFKLGTITIERTKSNERRTVPIPSILMTEMLKLDRQQERVFPYAFPRRAFVKAVKQAGIENFRFHDLRHTFASHMAMAGYNLRTIQQLLGHKDLRMVMRYSHLSAAHLGEAVNAVADSMLGVGTNVAQDRSRVA